MPQSEIIATYLQSGCPRGTEEKTPGAAWQPGVISPGASGPGGYGELHRREIDESLSCGSNSTQLLLLGIRFCFRVLAKSLFQGKIHLMRCRRNRWTMPHCKNTRI